jgi:hypothetical protein
MAPHASVATMSLGSEPEQRPVSPGLALPVGGWLAHHDVGLAWQPRPLAARDAARGRCWPLVPGCSPWARWWSPRGAVRGPAPGS